MGNSPSSASTDSDHDFPSGSEEAKAAKRNKRLQKQQRKQQQKQQQQQPQYKAPTLHPTAAKVVRPHDSQILFNHGRINIHGTGPEHQNFPCICRELAELRVESKQQLPSQPPTPKAATSTLEQQLKDINVSPQLNEATTATTPTTDDDPPSPTNITAPTTTDTNPDNKLPTIVPTPTPAPVTTHTIGLRRRNPLTGRCTNCGGILDDVNEMTIPSCTWQDGTVQLGSIVNSMVMAQRNFSESLRQVQSEDQPLVMLSKMTNFDMPTVRALQGVFSKISDHDGKDNLISAQELCLATGIPPDSLLGKALFRLMDITRSNNINFRTWIMMLSKLSPQASLEDKISFAFNIYDENGDGFIDRQDLVAMLCSVIPDLGEQDAIQLIESIFDVADADGDRRIDYDDYKQLVVNSHAFYEAFTIDIAKLLSEHYNVISDDVIAHRVNKLQERDLRQEERASQQSEKETLFMEREHEEVRIVDNLDDLDL